MANRSSDQPLRIFSTCPPSSDYEREYVRRVIDVSRWSEQCGCTGILVSIRSID
jgi:alkanesulfonate monooxygenase